jgi:hypothetical protein
MTGTNSATGVFNLGATLPTNALMGQNSGIYFFFTLYATNINFSDASNNTCFGSCPLDCDCALGCSCCGCDNSCACASVISHTQQL